MVIHYGKKFRIWRNYRSILFPLILGLIIGLTLGCIGRILGNWVIVDNIFNDTTKEMIQSLNFKQPRTELQSDILYNKELGSKVKVLCWVMTHPGNHERAIHISTTWGKRCNILVFMSTKSDNRIPVIVLNSTESRWNLWQKTCEAWKYIYRNHFNDSDWFLKVNDDSFVVLENLRYFLSKLDSKVPIQFGHSFKYKNLQMISSTPGYVLSKEGLRHFVKGALQGTILGPCGWLTLNSEEVTMGYCLNSLKVTLIDARDSLGRLLFLPSSMMSHIAPNKLQRSKIQGFQDSSSLPVETGINCCSDIAVAFHHITIQKMYKLEMFIYHIRPFGLARHEFAANEITNVFHSNKITQKIVISHL